MVKKLRAFPVKSEIREGCPLSPLLANMVMESQAWGNEQEHLLVGIQNGVEEVKLHYFHDKILYI